MKRKVAPIVLVVSSLLLTGCRGPEAVGGAGRETAQVLKDAEGEIRSARVMQEVLKRKGEILRYQLRLLEEEQNRWEFSDVPERREQWRRARGELMVLLQNERAAEFRIREALQELWEAQDEAKGWSRRYDAQRGHPVDLAWSVDTIREISAPFHDPVYEERFGIPHEGIDIPVLQGTEVRAAADGIVRTVSDRGQGFNSLSLVHDNGLVTLYGHVMSFLVTEGQQVRTGDPIARSGGEPGTPGAGLLSTGQHLHFEVIVDGKHVDPLEYLQ
ncbi:M23 family metallopeptidase [Candidatus Peregrinibacteria bacterium]|nr:M23 family metallopeptidase [Candidatus Peregrinibacteria bacterium]